MACVRTVFIRSERRQLIGERLLERRPPAAMTHDRSGIRHSPGGARIVVGFLLAEAYAWGFLQGRTGRCERTALAISLAAATLAAPLQIVIGDWAARQVAQKQPVKLAAIEGLPTTMSRAPVHLLGWFDGQRVVYRIELPGLLSLLAFRDRERDRLRSRSCAPTSPQAIVRGVTSTTGPGYRMERLERERGL
jgi:hypothetical protein